MGDSLERRLDLFIVDAALERIVRIIVAYGVFRWICVRNQLVLLDGDDLSPLGEVELRQLHEQLATAHVVIAFEFLDAFGFPRLIIRVG